VSPERAPESHLQTYTIADLHFDPENPRLPEGVDSGSEVEILRWMLQDATLLDLMGSMAEHGFFPGEPLLLSPRDESGYTVVEGNRRLAAVRLLSRPESAPVRQKSVAQLALTAQHRPTTVYGIPFESRDDILDYLGFRHITGVKEWGPLAKARYLRQLWNKTEGNHAERSRKLARKIGSQPYYVKRLLGGLKVYETIEDSGFYGIEGLGHDLSFSLLSTALSFDSLSRYLGVPDDPTDDTPLNDAHVRNFTHWVYERQPGGGTIVGDSRNLKALAAVVAKPDALKMLEQGASLSDAALVTEQPGQQFTRALKLTRDRIDSAQRLLRRVQTPTELDEELMNEILNTAEDMLSAFRRRSRRRGRD
jgi:hypothetical protein